MTDAGLPTPDLAAGDCVHSRMVSRAEDDCLPAAYCFECIDLALSRARDEGIEAAAQAAYRTVECSWCLEDEHVPGFVCACSAERARVVAAIRALKENRPR